MAYSKEEAREKVKALVEKFKMYHESGEAQKWKEEQTIIYLINPLFEALGWDVHSPEEVDYQSNIQAKSSKRPDYIFKLNGVPKFVVEAKAVKEDLNKEKYVKQALNYAWLKGLGWAVLTDFQGIKIFCADREYSNKNPLQNYFRDIPWTAYLSRFDDLWLLSKESFEKNLIGDLGEKELKRTPRIKIDKQFSLDLNQWRTRLRNNIKRNNHLSEEELSEIVQKILDRLIFIRTCEDREIGVGEKLNALVRQHEQSSRGLFSKWLNKIYFQYDQKFNSKLFTYNEKDPGNRHLCEKIKIDDKILYEIIHGMYKENDPAHAYDFSLIDADVLGNVYEQYLAYLQKGTIEKQKSKRKGQGIYYTPTYVVDYIVRNTLGEKLKRCRTPEDVLKIKVLDPACGSGSFLIRAYDEFKQWYEKYKAKKKTNGEQTKLDNESGKGYRSFMDNVLKSCIYGVDLDPKAVEIAQLNLLLKAADTRHKLPSLRDNVKCGDSLVSDPEVAGDKAFDWKVEFKEVMDSGGFDVVIGNPPYINAIELKKTVGSKVKDYWKERYLFARGAYDIYILFFEQALKISKAFGLISFITPNKYLSSPYGTAMREIVCRESTLVKVLDLSKVKVFQDPSVYPLITVIQNRRPSKEYNLVTERIFSENLEDKQEYKVSSKNLSVLPENLWGMILSENVRLIEKIFKNSKPLEEVAHVQATSTAKEADEYSKEVREGGSGLPLVHTGTIDRYSTTYGYHPIKIKGQKLLHPVLDPSKISGMRKEMYQNPKIIIAKLALRPEGFLDDKGGFSSINTNCIHSPKPDYPLKYLTALLNSKLIAFVYSELFAGLKMGGGYFQFQAPQLRILPIVKPSSKQLEQLGALVDKIKGLEERYVAIKEKDLREKENLKEKIEDVDYKIDQIVYNIYGLNEKEKKIIEESMQ